MPAMSSIPSEKIHLPRDQLLEALLAKINKSKNIKILFSSKCDNIVLNDGQVILSVHSNDKSFATKVMTPGLLLGCDGINSVVRTWLSDNENKNTGKKGKKNRFDPICLTSPTAGLRYKMITVKQG